MTIYILGDRKERKDPNEVAEAVNREVEQQLKREALEEKRVKKT